MIPVDFAVIALDDQEQDPGDDHEVDGDGDEVAPAEDGPLLLRLGISHAARHLARKRQVVVREVEPAGHGADDRHEQVADDRLDDLPERRPDDDADGKIDDVAAQRELLEFFEHLRLPPPSPYASPQPRKAGTGLVNAIKKQLGLK